MQIRTPQQPDSPATHAACARWIDLYLRGPQITRWVDVPVQAGDVAPLADLVDARTGAVRRLSELWSGHPALLIFWRHFGCSCGRDRAAKLIEEMELYRPLGATVAMICQGEPERAQVYLEANGIPDDVVCLLDSTEATYRAYGIVDCGPLEVFFDAPDEYLRRDEEAGRAIAKARRDAGMPVVDNTWLLPAEFVIAPDGKITYVYRHQFCENWIDPRVHVGAIRTANGEFSRW